MRLALRGWRRWKTAARKRTTRPAFRPRLEALEDRCVPSAAAEFVQTNLVSDVPGMAANTDSQLVNPWGLTTPPGGPFWVSDNQTGLTTLYDNLGNKFATFNIPKAPGSSFAHATPTGTVFNTDNNPNDFVVTAPGPNGTAPSFFLFATLDGTISGWNGNGPNAILAVKNPGAVYTGLAMDTNASNSLLYAADWGKGTVDVFNGNFQQIDQNAFKDPAIPAGFRPFNVQDINGKVYVTYAQFDPTTSADTGTGGFVARYSRDGVLQQTITGAGWFNSPWGIALAPSGFGRLSGDLLVGNFGDGTINAFNPHNGHFMGQLQTTAGLPFQVDNLWALEFGQGGVSGSPDTLFFTAGVKDAPATIFGASHGLFGSLQAVPTLPGHTIIPNLPNAVEQMVSTIPPSGDLNPYGVAFVPQNYTGGGDLAPGDVLVSNFNGPANLQGTGSSIVRITPDGQQSVFFQEPTGLGLTTALGVLPQGFVLVGSLPTTYDVHGNATPHNGSLIILNSHGKVVSDLADSALLQGPWDLTINSEGNTAEVFVSNVLSGTVTRIDLNLPPGAKAPQVESETQIASGYVHRRDPAALVVGPTGLAFDAKTGTLYVASTGDNKIYAIAKAATATTDQGTGQVVVQSDNLHGPLALALAPNGDLLVANSDAVNQDPNHLNELSEFTPKGKFVGQFQIDPGAAGGAFGLAVQDVNGQIRFAAVDDNTNSLDIFTFLLRGSGEGKDDHRGG
jgi:uncharacterized protein (TIGR03118 family)